MGTGLWKVKEGLWDCERKEGRRGEGSTLPGAGRRAGEYRLEGIEGEIQQELGTGAELHVLKANWPCDLACSSTTGRTMISNTGVNRNTYADGGLQVYHHSIHFHSFMHSASDVQ